MASRAAYTARVGPIPDDAVIVPKCGEPSCIRPDRLWANEAITAIVRYPTDSDRNPRQSRPDLYGRI